LPILNDRVAHTFNVGGWPTRLGGRWGGKNPTSKEVGYPAEIS